MIAGVDGRGHYFAYLEQNFKDFAMLRQTHILIGQIIRTRLPLREILELKLDDDKPIRGGRVLEYDKENSVHHVYMPTDYYHVIDRNGYVTFDAGVGDGKVNVVDEKALKDSYELHEFYWYRKFLDTFVRDPEGSGLKAEKGSIIKGSQFLHRYRQH